MILIKLKKYFSLKETRLIAIISLISIILSSAPYLYLYLTKPINTVYLWAHAFNTGDTMVYFSYIEQVKQGHYLFRDLFTSESHLRFLNVFWLSVGLLAKVLNLSSAAAYHTIRILLIPILIWTLKKTVDFFLPNHRHSTIILLFLAYFTGFGLMLNPLLHSGIVAEMVAGLDLVCPEATPYLSMLFSGHFILSWICLLWSIMLITKMYALKNFKYAFLAGLLNLFFIQFHPYYAPLIFAYSVCAGLYYYLLKQNQAIKTIGLFTTHLLISLPAILYYTYLLFFDFRFQIFFKQNNTPSPEWWVILFSFGPLFPLAIFYIIKLYKNKGFSEKTTLLTIWLSLSSILLFLPLNSQRRFIEGMSVPILFLAWPILENLYLFIVKHKEKQVVRNFLILLILLISSQTTFFIFIITQRLQHKQPDYIYYSADVLPPIQWLKTNSPKSNIILASKYSSPLIAGLAGRQNYFGHKGETIFFDEKEKIVQNFFSIFSDKERINFLNENKISLLYWGKKEKLLANEFNPNTKMFLKKIYDNTETQIYRVLK